MASLAPQPDALALNRSPWTRREGWALAAILALAGLLRMGWPGLTEFKQDEAHLYGLALDLAQLKAFPLHGITSSIGLPNAPASVYVFALPLLLWASPLAATIFVGALNTASVALGYVMARRYWGRTAALAGALVYATAPWAIIYSRKIWAQDLLPLFVVAYIFSGLLAFVEGRRRWLAVHLALLAIIIELHLSGLALSPLTLLLLVLYWRRVDARALAVGVALALLTAAPIGFYLIGRPGNLSNNAAIAGQLLAHPAAFSADALTLPATLVLGTDVHSLAGPAAFRAFDATLPDFDPLLVLGGAAVLAGLGLALWRWWAGRGRPRSAGVQAGLISALWLVLPCLFFLRHSTPVFPHYFIILFPAPFLLAGLAAQPLLARWRWLWLAPLALAAAQAWTGLAVLHFVGTQATPGAFGTPLGLMLQTAQAARQTGQPEILVVADGTQTGTDLAPAVFDALLRDYPHRFVDGRTTAVFPAGPAAAILWPGDSADDWPVSALYRAWGGGDWRQVIPLRQGEGQALLAVSTGAQPVVPRALNTPVLLDNGVTLEGSARGAGGWQMWWRPPGPLPGTQYQVFAHVYTSFGQQLAQVDQSAGPPDAWHAGDLVVSRFSLPAGGAVVRAGMYAYPSLAPTNVLDVAGNPAGQWVDFPP